MTQFQSPLDWPAGWPRCELRVRARFAAGRSAWTAAAGLEAELRRLGATSTVVTSNLPVRVDGRGFLANQPRLSDPGCSAFFELGGRRIVLACDRWDLVEHNLHAVAKHVEALRGQERWGVGNVERAFSGYVALPPAPAETWRGDLGLDPGPFTESDVQALFREGAKTHHPDVGGTNGDMDRLVRARDEALRFLAGAARG